MVRANSIRLERDKVDHPGNKGRKIDNTLQKYNPVFQWIRYTKYGWPDTTTCTQDLTIEGIN